MFFLAAANVMKDCEVDLAIWLKLCAIAMVIILPVDHLLIYAFSKCSATYCFKLARFLSFAAPLMYIGYSLSGFGIYASVSEDRCLKRGWSGVHPITLVLAWAVIGSLFGCVVLCIACRMIFANMAEDDDMPPSKVAPEP